MLRKVYGEIIVPSGTILYNIENYDKAMLFCIFHPSEYGEMDDPITFIKLKKDISLLFMIEDCKKLKIFSSLLSLTKYSVMRTARKYNLQLLSYVEELKKENFDGWFTSIDNKGTVEVSIINDETIFEIIKEDTLKRYWRNGYYDNATETYIPKDWGKKYPIIDKPVKLKINDKYKNMIDQYQEFNIKNNPYKDYVFHYLLNNAEIYYHEAEFEKIEWKMIDTHFSQP